MRPSTPPPPQESSPDFSRAVRLGRAGQQHNDKILVSKTIFIVTCRIQKNSKLGFVYQSRLGSSPFFPSFSLDPRSHGIFMHASERAEAEEEEEEEEEEEDESILKLPLRSSFATY